MKAATLFSGIGAPEVAMPHWDWKFCAEIGEFQSEIHRIRHGVQNLKDVTHHDFIERAKKFGAIDVLVYGSPCQAFSEAGKRLGLNDPRGNLAIVAIEVIKALRPKWFVFENVRGLLFSGKGDDFKIILSKIEECGYLGAWRVLDSRYFGVPQRRRRLFFVGYFGDWRPPASVLFEPEILRRGATPRSDENAANPEKSGNGAEQHNCYSGKTITPIAVNLRGREGGAMPEIAEFASLRASRGGGSRSYIASDVFRMMTPIECERLQGFQDGFTKIAWKGKSIENCADTNRYEALGNSMAVPVMRWILERIEIADALIC